MPPLPAVEAAAGAGVGRGAGVGSGGGTGETEHGQRDAGWRDVFAEEQKPSEQTGEHAEQPDAGEQVGEGDAVEPKCGHHRQREGQVDQEFRAEEGAGAEQARACGAEEADDERASEGEHHPASVGFERVIVEPTTKDGRPEDDADG